MKTNVLDRPGLLELISFVSAGSLKDYELIDPEEILTYNDEVFDTWLILTSCKGCWESFKYELSQPIRDSEDEEAFCELYRTELDKLVADYKEVCKDLYVLWARV